MLKKIGENREIIWIDLDETIWYTVKKVLEDNKIKVWNTLIKEKDVVNYYLHKIKWININQEEAIEIFRNVYRNDFDKLLLEPVDWAKEKMKNFLDKWYENHIVTARDWNLFSDYTEKWVDKYYKNLINKIHFANHFWNNEIPKSELCKKNWISKMIEDNLDYWLELARNWIQTYILHKPWNYRRKDKHELLKRVEDWSEIEI